MSIGQIGQSLEATERGNLAVAYTPEPESY